MFRALTIMTVSVAALAASTPASADTVQVGMLQCGGGPSLGYLIGSSTAINCVFYPSTGKRSEGYAGAVNRLGVDVGFTGASGLSWLVFAPSANVGRGALAGQYGGVSANASVIVGGGANLLAGGLNNSITLQPVSVQGQTGINVAATATNMELQSLAPVSSGSKKKNSKKKKS